MSKSSSRFLNDRQLKTFECIGDIYCPANTPFPSFSELGAIEHIDLVIEDLPDQDRNDLGLLLFVLSFLPTFFLKGLVSILEMATGWPKPIAMPFLLIRFGLRGIVFSLYYSGYKGSTYKGAAPTQIIGFNLIKVPGSISVP